MKRLKKGVIGFLALALLISYIPVKILLAGEIDSNATTNLVAMSEAKGKTGDLVEVTLSTTQSIQVKSFSISGLEYDKTKLQLVDGEWNVDGLISDWGSLNEGEGVLAFRDNQAVDGKFFTLTFKIIEELEDCDVTVTCDVGAKAKQNDGTEEPLDVSVSAGKVTVETIKNRIVVGSGNGYLGKQISVPISLEQNPGIANMELSVDYDASILKLNSVQDGGKLGLAMHGDDLTAVPYSLCWKNSTITENITYNGEIVVLVFDVLEDATLGSTYINVSYDYDNADILDVDYNPVMFGIVNGEYVISDVLIGDVNGDGRVNSIDRMMLARYIAEWDGYTNETINMTAADVNEDGRVNSIDRMILARYIAEWEGYETLPYKK